jgi:large subunit ribosomal protein L23
MEALNDPYLVVKRPIVSEKSMMASETTRAYTFEVDLRANKIQVRSAVEQIFGVKVEQVRTMHVRGKVRRLGWRGGRKPDWKKAIVKLAEGHTIEIV